MNDTELLAMARSIAARMTPKRRARATTRQRAAVLKRDKNRCRKCGSTSQLVVHHVKHHAKGGSNRMANLVTLCQRCEDLEHRR